MSRRKKGRQFPCSDAGNAEIIADKLGDELRYDHKQGRWLLWESRRRRWSEDKEEGVRVYAIAAARNRLKVVFRRKDREKNKSEIRWALESENGHRLDAALNIAKSLTPVSDPGDGWDADPWLFGVANGVIELKTGKLREATQKDRITRFSPVTFDPSATCPRFEQFLAEIFDGDMALVDYMQRMVGYCLTGSIREQCLFCWWGSGSNGKTTLLNVLRYVFGDHAVNLPFSALEMTNRNSHDLVALACTRFATASETNEGLRLNEARIKMLTGSDPVPARRLYHMPFTFEPTHKLVLAFNHKPVIADDSEGMWRRVRLIPFTRQFKSEEQVKNLADKLKDEAPGILAWALRGCLLWQKEGLGMPPAVAVATAAYREESDHMGTFIGDCCVVAPGATVTSKVLWQQYQRWAAENEEVALSRKAFAERLEKRGFRPGRGRHGGTRTWSGICLRESSGEGSPTQPPADGDTVTQGDASSDNSLSREDIEKFSKSAPPPVTTSPSRRSDAGIEGLLARLGNKSGPPIDWDAPETQSWDRE
jgi:putative DNA primase/helicase